MLFCNGLVDLAFELVLRAGLQNLCDVREASIAIYEPLDFLLLNGRFIHGRRVHLYIHVRRRGMQVGMGAGVARAFVIFVLALINAVY